MKQLEYNIAKNLDSIAEAYNRKNKLLYKQCLISLELDLAEYEQESKTRHPASDQLIKLYEKLWDFT